MTLSYKYFALRASKAYVYMNLRWIKEGEGRIEGHREGARGRKIERYKEGERGIDSENEGYEREGMRGRERKQDRETHKQKTRERNRERKRERE